MSTGLTSDLWARYYAGNIPVPIMQSLVILAFFGHKVTEAKSISFKESGGGVRNAVIDYSDKIVIACFDRSELPMRTVLIEVRGRSISYISDVKFGKELIRFTDQPRKEIFSELTKLCKTALTHLQFHDLTYKLEKVIKQLDNKATVDAMRLLEPPVLYGQDQELSIDPHDSFHASNRFPD